MSDLIRREDAIRAVAEVLSLNRFASFKDIKDFGRFAERMLRNVPSADRPHGEWIKFGLGRGTRIRFCTNCKRRIEVPLSQGDSNYDFCPNCGARMKGADDE